MKNNSTYPMADALAEWIVQVRWALQRCHEQIGLAQLGDVIDAEAKLLVELGRGVVSDDT